MTTLIPKFQQTGAGAVNVPFTTKLKESVSVLDFGADPTGVADSTAAFTAALTAAKFVRAPVGTYLLDNLRYVKSGNQIIGDGYTATYFKQSNAGRPAINCTSDVTTGQLIGVALSDCTITGATSATVAAVLIQATTPYIVSESNFDYKASNTYAALNMVCTASNELYSNKIKVNSTGTTGTAVTTVGVYNIYDIFAVNTANGFAIQDSSINSTFIRSVTDGQQTFAGQNCTMINPTVETIYGSGASTALRFNGYAHVAINPTVTSVANSKVSSGYGLSVGNDTTLIKPRVWGSVYPAYPIDTQNTGSPTIIDGQIASSFKIEQYLSIAGLAKVTMIGARSTYSFSNNSFFSIPYTIIAATYTLDTDKSNGINYVLINNYASSVTLTLPVTAEQKGRVIKIVNYTAQTVSSATSNIIAITGGAAGTAILAATAGKWATLQFNGTNWVIVEAN